MYNEDFVTDSARFTILGQNISQLSLKMNGTRAIG